MTHVSIDLQPEAVKQFFRSLTLTPEGSIVEIGGKPVAKMLPADARGPQWSDAKATRRLALIEREIAGTMTADEALELDLLQEELQRHVEQVAPLPLDYARQLHKELMAKAAANGSS